VQCVYRSFVPLQLTDCPDRGVQGASTRFHALAWRFSNLQSIRSKATARIAALEKQVPSSAEETKLELTRQKQCVAEAKKAMAEISAKRHNLVRDIHERVIRFLCSFDVIFLPPFPVSKFVARYAPASSSSSSSSSSSTTTAPASSSTSSSPAPSSSSSQSDSSASSSASAASASSSASPAAGGGGGGGGAGAGAGGSSASSLPRNIRRAMRRLNKTAVQSLLGWSHGLFRQRLLAALQEHPEIRLFFESEAYSSKSCTNCGVHNDKLGGSRTFRCKACRYEGHRDVSAARSIFLRALSLHPELCRQLGFDSWPSVW
jgi:hypothetical protein